MPKLTAEMGVGMTGIVFENLTNGRRVRNSGTHLELSASIIRKFKPVCLLTTNVWELDKLPADVRVVDNRVVAVPDGYDLTKAFHFRVGHPVMEARIDMTKMNATTRGLTFKLHKADYTRTEYVCVPSGSETVECLGTNSNDRGAGAVTKADYDYLAHLNECRVALLMLKGVDKNTGNDYEPVPIGAVLYADNKKCTGGTITSAWYDNRDCTKKEVCTTFGWSPPVRARQEPDFTTAPLQDVQGSPEYEPLEDVPESISDVLIQLATRSKSERESYELEIVKLKEERSRSEQERDGLRKSLKESKQQWEQERESLKESKQQWERERESLTESKQQWERERESLTESKQQWEHERGGLKKSLKESESKEQGMKEEIASHKRKCTELRSEVEKHKRAKNEGAQAAISELRHQLKQKNTELLQQEAEIAKANKKATVLKSVIKQEQEKFQKFLDEKF